MNLIFTFPFPWLLSVIIMKVNGLQLKNAFKITWEVEAIWPNNEWCAVFLYWGECIFLAAKWLSAFPYVFLKNNIPSSFQRQSQSFYFADAGEEK